MSLQQLLELSRKNRTSSIASHLLKSPFVGYFESDFKAALSLKDAIEVARIDWAKHCLKCLINPNFEKSRLDDPLEDYLPGVLLIRRNRINGPAFWNAAFFSNAGHLGSEPAPHLLLAGKPIFIQSDEFNMEVLEREANIFFDNNSQIPPHLLEKNPFLITDERPTGWYTEK